MHGWQLPISLPSSFARPRPRPPVPGPWSLPPSPVSAADASLIGRIPIRSDVLATGFVVVQMRRPILSIGVRQDRTRRKINDAICYGAACQRESLRGPMGRTLPKLFRAPPKIDSCMQSEWKRVLREEMEDLWLRRRGIHLPYIVILHSQPFL